MPAVSLIRTTVSCTPRTHARTAPLRESVMCVRALPLKRSGAAHRSYSTPTHQPSPISQCGCPNLKPLTLKPLNLKPLGVEYRNTHAFTCIQLRARMKYKYMYSKLPCAYSGTRVAGDAVQSEICRTRRLGVGLAHRWPLSLLDFVGVHATSWYVMSGGQPPDRLPKSFRVYPYWKVVIPS
jgi:hypothetical protein